MMLTMIEEDWRVMVQVETTDREDTCRKVTVDLPRSGFGLAELHDLAREMAEAANVLTEESSTVSVRVTFL